MNWDRHIDFTGKGEMLRLLDLAGELKSKLTEAQTDRWYSEIGEVFLPAFVYNSGAFEGITETWEKTADLLCGKYVPDCPLEKRVQITGYRDAFYCAMQRVGDGLPLDEETDKLLHFISTPMGDSRRGEYRDCQIHVSIRKHIPPEAEDVPEEMQRLFANLSDCPFPASLKAAWLHLQHEAIHPFHLCNGRTERILLNYILMEDGWLPVCVDILDRGEYLSFFDEYYASGNIVPMASYLLKLEIRELEKAMSN